MFSVPILEAIRLDLLNLYAASNKLLPSDSISAEFLNWLGIRPTVEKASTHIFVHWIASPMALAKLISDGASMGTQNMLVVKVL